MWLRSINNLNYLKELLDNGYVVRGPRKDHKRDLVSFKAFLKKEKVFMPECHLKNMNYEFVEPTVFTKGYKLAYKEINTTTIDQWFKSNYSLVKDDITIPLYLKGEKDA